MKLFLQAAISSPALLYSCANVCNLLYNEPLTYSTLFIIQYMPDPLKSYVFEIIPWEISIISLFFFKYRIDPISERHPRITSYNVCYTKLLRRSPPQQWAGWSLVFGSNAGRERKVRAPQGRVLANSQARRLDGQCHREETAARSALRARRSR